MSDDDDHFRESFVKAENAEDVDSFDAGDTTQIKKREDAIAFQMRTCRDWWTAALNNEIGRKCMWDLLASTAYFDSPFMATPTGFPDVNATFFKLGRQDVGKSLYHDLMGHSAEGVMLMLKEHHPQFKQGVAHV